MGSRLLKIRFFNFCIFLFLPYVGIGATSEQSTKDNRNVIYYHKPINKQMHLIKLNDAVLQGIEHGSCPGNGILLVNTIEDYSKSIGVCPPKKLAGYFINPAFFSLSSMKKNGFNYYGIASTATILMQIALAQDIYSKNDFSKIIVLASTDLENSIVQTYLSSKEGKQIKNHIQLIHIRSAQNFIETLSDVTSEENIILVFGGVSSYLNNSILEVMFESLYNKGSIIIGGPDERLLKNGFIMGVYTDKDKANAVLNRWAKQEEIDADGILNLLSPQMKSYMVIKENDNLMRVIGIRR